MLLNNVTFCEHTYDEVKVTQAESLRSSAQLFFGVFLLAVPRFLHHCSFLGRLIARANLTSVVSLRATVCAVSMHAAPSCGGGRGGEGVKDKGDGQGNKKSAVEAPRFFG